MASIPISIDGVLNASQEGIMKAAFAQVTRSSWGLDPFTRGSYSYVSKAATSDDVTSLGQPVLARQQGVSRPVICIAGEATSRKYIGTTAGAYFSGVREAERLIESFASA